MYIFKTLYRDVIRNELTITFTAGCNKDTSWLLVWITQNVDPHVVFPWKGSYS